MKTKALVCESLTEDLSGVSLQELESTRNFAPTNAY